MAAGLRRPATRQACSALSAHSAAGLPSALRQQAPIRLTCNAFQLQGNDTYTYDGVLNLVGIQYSSVMFIG